MERQCSGRSIPHVNHLIPNCVPRPVFDSLIESSTLRLGWGVTVSIGSLEFCSLVFSTQHVVPRLGDGDDSRILKGKQGCRPAFGTQFFGPSQPEVSRKQVSKGGINVSSPANVFQAQRADPGTEEPRPRLRLDVNCASKTAHFCKTTPNFTGSSAEDK